MKKDYHEFKKEYHIFRNIFNIIAVTWAASIIIGILTLFSVLFIKTKRKTRYFSDEM